MSRRMNLIALLCIEGLLWLAVQVMPLNQFGNVTFSGPLLGPLVNLVIVALLFTPAVLVGALCRQWQSAIALNPLAIIPAGAASLLVPYTGTAYDVGGLTLFVAIAALGLLGWLLRFVRAEFAA